MKKKEYMQPSVNVYRVAMQQPLMVISGGKAGIYEDEVDEDGIL